MSFFPRWRRWLAAVGAGAALLGCGRSVQPPARQLTAPPPPKSWASGKVMAAPQQDWWAYLGDAGLDRVIQQALTRNHDLRTAAARIEMARAEARIAGAAELPQLDVSVNRGRERRNFVGFPIPGGEDRVLSTTFTSAGLSFGLNWEADVWKRIQAGKLAAVASQEARQAELQAARLSLTAQAAKAWITAVEARRQLGLARASLESYQLSADRIRARFAAGLRPSLDLRLALTEVSTAEARVRQWREAYERALRNIEVLIGDYPAGEIEVAEDLPEVPGSIPGGLPSELLYRRPDLLAAERQLLAADTRIVSAQADLRPRFQLTSGTGTASNTLKDLVNTDLFVWNLLGGVTQPLFNNGRLKANVNLAEARADEAVALYEQKILQSYGEVEAALAAESLLAERERALEEATRQSLAARDLAEQRYRAGLTDIITMLQSQRSALEAESQLLAIRRLRLENRINLHLAMGGGFEAGPGSPAPQPAGRPDPFGGS